MLNHISWTTYFEIIIFLAAIYYAFVLFRYYTGDMRQLVQPSQAKTDVRQVPEALRYEQPEEIHHPAAEHLPDNYLNDQRDESIEATGDLTHRIKDCIQTASGKPFAPAVLIPQIKKIFRENPDMLHSPHREAINELVVQECERTGTALLTEDEVDQWWTD